MSEMLAIGLSQYPIPDATTSVSRGGWVDYGDDNCYPDWLTELYKGSGVHNAICNGIAQMAYGKGVVSVETDLAKRGEIEAALRKMNSRESGSDVIKKSFRDLKIYGRCYWQVIMTADGKQIAEIHHIPFAWVRAGEKDESGEIREWYVSRDWMQYRRKDYKPYSKPSWNRGVMSGIMPITLFGEDHAYYPSPDYIGSLNWIAVDMEVSKFHLNAINNQFAPSYHIHHSNGVPTQRERQEMKREYERELAGPENAGGIVMTFSEGDDRKTEFNSLAPSQLDKQYTFISEEASKKIMIGHRVTTPALFGIRDGAGLGNNAEELETGMKFLTQNVLEGYRQTVTQALENVFGSEFIVVTEEQVDGEVQDTATLEAQAALKGSVGGVGGVISILQSVAAEEMDKASAVVILQELYGFERSVAEKTVFGEVLTPEAGQEVEMSSCGHHHHLSAEDDQLILPEGKDDELIAQLAQIAIDKAQFEENWNLIDEEIIEGEPCDDRFVTRQYSFAIDSKPDQSSSLDSGFYRVRYEYVTAGSEPDVIDTTRTFCRSMMTTHKGRIFRKEDINQMSFRGENKEFGQYSIFKFKGSYNCRHRWKRLVYFLKRVPAGQSVTVNGKTYKGGQYLPADRMSHFRVLPNKGGYPNPLNDSQAIRRNPKVKR